MERDRTITFRPTGWELALIEERLALSGMTNREFIIRSCIYSRIVMVGDKKNIQRIVEELQEMQNVMQEIAGMITSGDFSLPEDAFQGMVERFLALTVTVMDIIEGAAYLFGKENPEQEDRDSKEIEQYRHILGKGKDKNLERNKNSGK